MSTPLVHHFLTLPTTTQAAIATKVKNESQDKGNFKGLYQNALNYMRGSLTSITEDAQNLVTVLNEKAESRIFVEQVGPAWQKQVQNITDLATCAQWIGNGSVCFIGAAAGCALWYLKSNKLIAGAALCYALAAAVLRSLCYPLARAWKKCAENIQKLTNTTTPKDFKKGINAVYQELSNTHLLTRLCFGFPPNPHEFLGLDKLTAQVNAFNALNQLVNVAIWGMVTGLSKPVDQDELKKIFGSLEKLCRTWMVISAGIGAMAMAFNYYAYLQKSYFVLVAGVVYFLGVFLITTELFRIQKSAKAMSNSAPVDVTVLDSGFFNRLGCKTATVEAVYNQVALPLADILKVIPFGKAVN